MMAIKPLFNMICALTKPRDQRSLPQAYKGTRMIPGMLSGKLPQGRICTPLAVGHGTAFAVHARQ
jgi:hypothetical protein